MKIAVDMTWMKPGKTGGGESFIRNLLDGFKSLDIDNEYILFCAKDNYGSLKHYEKDNRFLVIKCGVSASNIKAHLIWQSTMEFSIIKKYNPDLIYSPVYETPYFKFNKIPMVSGILDIQAVHYPEYFSKAENFIFKKLWQRCIDNSDLILTISDFCVKDIIKHLKRVNNIKRIYIPVVLNLDKDIDFASISKKYSISKNKYFYTVCSMHKHKNLITLLKMMKEFEFDCKLVISGVSGPNKKEVIKYIESNNLSNKVVLTKFISNEERNCLIENSNCFLFPSVFEGFGMPPIEAMMLGAKVITTKCASIYEVTQGKCNYVNNPYSVEEWKKNIEKIQNQEKIKYTFPEYDLETLAKEYLEIFKKVEEGNKCKH